MTIFSIDAGLGIAGAQETISSNSAIERIGNLILYGIVIGAGLVLGTIIGFLVGITTGIISFSC